MAQRSTNGTDSITQKNIEEVSKIEKAAYAKRSAADRIADRITSFCGSMRFVYVHLVFYALWIIANCAGPKIFDPYPFQFLNLFMAFEAIFLSTFILISQNHEARISRNRNQLDLQINLLSEQENSKMLAMLEQLIEHAGLKLDPEVLKLKQITEPQTLIDQLETMLNIPAKK